MTNCVGHLLAAPLWLFSWSQWPLKLLCVLIFIHAGRINVLRIQRTSSQSHTDNVQFKFSLTGGWISYSVTSIWRYSWSQELFFQTCQTCFTQKYNRIKHKMKLPVKHIFIFMVQTTSSVSATDTKDNMKQNWFSPIYFCIFFMHFLTCPLSWDQFCTYWLIDITEHRSVGHASVDHRRRKKQAW